VSERKALEGKRIVVTRAREPAAELSDKLRALGAMSIEWPMIAFAPPDDGAPLDEAIQHIRQYAWVVFSSANGVRFFCERLANSKALIQRIAAVGERTAEALRRNGLSVDVVPTEFTAAQLASALGEAVGQKILLLHPDIAPPDLAQSLRAHGAQVDEIVTYRTVPVQYEQPITLDDVDAVTFASASAAQNFVAQLRGRSVPESVCIACIGPSTAAAARKVGLRVSVVAGTHTLDGLVESLVAYFQER
jgi:uroporphyrinogen-III synthase